MAPSSSENSPRWTHDPYLWCVACGLLSFFVVWFYLTGYLATDVFISDIPVYWQNSDEVTAPYDRYHPPGYGMVLALARLVTFDHFQPVKVMAAVSALFYIAGALVVVACAGQRASATVAGISGLLFLLWPLVGVTYVVYPVADSLAMFLVALCIWLLLGERFGWAWLVCAMLMITHKGTWPFVGLLMMCAVLQHWRQLGVRLAFAALVPVPIVTVWAMGAKHYNSATWMFSKSVTADVASRGPVPVLDGLFGTVLSGTTTGVIKGLAAWGVLLLCVVLVIAAWRETKTAATWYGLALVNGVLFLTMVLNQNTIWAAIRFSKILVIPAAWSLGALLPFEGRPRARGVAVGVVLLVLLASQLAFAWHFATAFAGAE